MEHTNIKVFQDIVNTKGSKLCYMWFTLNFNWGMKSFCRKWKKMFLLTSADLFKYIKNIFKTTGIIDCFFEFIFFQLFFI